MTDRIDPKNYYPANAKVLEKPVEEADGLATSTRRRIEKGLRSEVNIRVPSNVLKYALKCDDCGKYLTRNGRVFVTDEVFTREVSNNSGPGSPGVWFLLQGGHRALGWVEDGKAVTTDLYDRYEVPIGELCCQDCGNISKENVSYHANHELFLPAVVVQRDGEDVDVTEILPDDFQGDELRIEVPPYAFIPDEWSRAFLRGLAKVDVKDKFCLEVGVGTGINVIYLLAKSPEAIVFCDKDRRCTPLACRNIKRNVPENQCANAVPYAGSLDLLTWVKRTGIVRSRNFDVIYGCLPQVILPEGKQIDEGDALAHYYERDRYASDFEIYGLALNDIFLQQAHSCLDKDGRVVLNLGGRPGQDILEELFRKNGFEPQLLHKEVIEQHAGTSIESLVTLEVAAGRSFEFFEDEAATQQISATQAEERRRSGLPIFHRIYVYQGHKIS